MSNRKHVDVWAGARTTHGYTQDHTPLLWENMLGTVYAKRHGDEEAEYFDYNWADAHAHIGLGDYTDLRVCKVKYQYQGWPRVGKFALFGVRKVPQSELRTQLDNADRLLDEMPKVKWVEASRRRALKRLLDAQLRDLDCC